MNIEERVQENGEHLARHDEQIKTLFSQQEDIKKLAESTHALALSVEKLTARICTVEDDLQILNADKRQKTYAIWQIVVSAIIGGAATFILTHILH